MMVLCDKRTNHACIPRQTNRSKNMAEDTFHETQHDLARTLIQTFYEALAVQFDRKDHITKDELDRAFNLIEGFWPKTLPAFKANCRLCIDKNGARAYNPD